MSYSSGVNHFAGSAEHADLAPVAERLAAHALTLAGGGVEQHDIGDMDGCLALDDAARLVELRVRLGVALDQVEVLHEHAIADHARDFAALALALARDHDHLVAFSDSVHSLDLCRAGFSPPSAFIRHLPAGRDPPCNIRSLQHLGSQRDDLHEALAAQLARHRPEDAGADRLELVVEQHGCVAVETDQRTVGPTHALGGANHHGVVHLALLDLAARDGVAHGNLDDVADAGIAALGAAQHLDAHQFLRAAVVGRGQRGLHLDHGCDLLTRPRARRFRPRGGAWSWTSAGIRRCAPGRPRAHRSRHAHAAWSSGGAACRTGHAVPGARSAP